MAAMEDTQLPPEPGLPTFFRKFLNTRKSANNEKKSTGDFSARDVEPGRIYGSSIEEANQSSLTSYSLWDPENDEKRSAGSQCSEERTCNVLMIFVTVVVVAVVVAAFVSTQLGNIIGTGNKSRGLQSRYVAFEVSLNVAGPRASDEFSEEYIRSMVETIFGQSEIREAFDRTILEDSNDDPAAVKLVLYFLKSKRNSGKLSIDVVRRTLVEGLKLVEPGIIDTENIHLKQINEGELMHPEKLHRVTRGALQNVNKLSTPSSGEILNLKISKRAAKQKISNVTKPLRKNSPVYTFKLSHGENLREVLGKLLANLSLGKTPRDMKLNLGSSVPENSTNVSPFTLASLDQQNRLKSGSNSEDEIAITEFSNDIFEQNDLIANVTAVKTGNNVTSTLKACDAEKSFKCLNGECVSSLSRCNLMRDCSDNSDELNCKCADFFRAQFLGRKICDGIVDCWDFSDENECEWCSPDKYICSNSKTCIERHKICDGFKDCPSGDDEKHCIAIAQDEKTLESNTYANAGYVMVRRHGHWGKLCTQNFDLVAKKMPISFGLAELGNAVCSGATFAHVDRIDRRTDLQSQNQSFSDFPYYEISEPLNSHDTENFTSELSSSSFLEFKPSKCSRREIVHVTCRGLECGVRPKLSPARARIVGGGNAAPGAWPWQAALYKEGDFQCGATLINDRWLLSAGHCFYHALDDHWVARLGALRRGSNLISPYEQIRVVSHILIHPSYVDTGFINDISLLRIEEPVQFTDYVRPVCLPPPDQDIKDGRFCTVVGWGQLQESGRLFPDTLQEVQLPMLSTEECRKRTLFLPIYRLTNNMFCAGFDRGGRDACLGDSGGPLMCQEEDGRWSVYGVTSNGYGCARPNRPGVYTKVSRYVTWIQSILNGTTTNKKKKSFCDGHRCLLGECLPKSHVCNGIAECSDASDEKNCTSS